MTSLDDAGNAIGTFPESMGFGPGLEIPPGATYEHTSGDFSLKPTSKGVRGTVKSLEFIGGELWAASKN